MTNELNFQSHSSTKEVNRNPHKIEIQIEIYKTSKESLRMNECSALDFHLHVLKFLDVDKRQTEILH